MSCEDVIELGSSEEETEPAPKRSKPTFDAKVCIPKKLHEVTIKPANSNPTSIRKPLIKTGMIIQKGCNTKPQIQVKNKLNGKTPLLGLKPRIAYNPYSEQIKGPIIQPCNKKVGFTQIVKAPIQIKKSHINLPCNNKAGYSQIVKAATQIKNKSQINLQCNNKAAYTKIVNAPTQIKTKSHINIPSGITIKRTMPGKLSILKLNIENKQPCPDSNAAKEVLTVELDDDEPSTEKSNSPQWYIRPEDENKISSLENENNKEPDTTKITEITIEDSPVKPKVIKKINEVSSELAIIIEDSPVKAVVDMKKVSSGSEKEDDDTTNKEQHSKKKLEYPKDTESNKTIEIEIDLSEVALSNDCDLSEKVEGVSTTLEGVDETKLNDNTKAVELDLNVKSSNENNTSDLTEFHPVYQSFIELCFQLENSDDMKKIVEKKIKGYYRQVPKEYTESEEFTDMVSSKILSMKASPDKMYLYIKDIVDELNMQRKLAKSQPVVEVPKTEETARSYGDESQYDSKRQRQIRKLEKTIKKLHRAIQKLEEEEVDFDDEDESVYLLTERYKERMVRVYSKFCQLSNTKMPSEPRIQIDPAPGQPSGPAKRLEKWINKKVPIGTPLPFPDFHDVLRCVREANEEDRLGFNEADIMEAARDLFVRCGKKLQRRRQENEWRLAASRITVDIDPAEKSSELKQKLSENKKIATNKEVEIFNKYADRQNQLKLEAEEIGDKEAEESPVESEEEDADIILDNAENTKEGPELLLQEQSTKTCEEKEPPTPNEDQKHENETTIIESNVSQNGSVENKVVSRTDTVMEPETDANVETAKEAATTEMNVPVNTDMEIQILEDSQNDSKDNADQSMTNEMNSPTVAVTLSDDSYVVESDSDLQSDIDKHHLLQKLPFKYEDPSSTVCSSDSGSQIETSEDNRMDTNADVISIENSSYSENEREEYIEQSNIENIQHNSEADPASMRVVTATSIVKVVQAPIHTNNDECDGPVENVLLASTEEENSQDEPAGGTCFNVRDLISIDETFIGITNRTDSLAGQISDNNINKGILVEEIVENNEIHNGHVINEPAVKHCGLLEETSPKSSIVVEDDHSNTPLMDTEP